MAQKCRFSQGMGWQNYGCNCTGPVSQTSPCNPAAAWAVVQNEVIDLKTACCIYSVFTFLTDNDGLTKTGSGQIQMQGGMNLKQGSLLSGKRRVRCGVPRDQNGGAASGGRLAYVYACEQHDRKQPLLQVQGLR
jgi:hypothetical protein